MSSARETGHGTKTNHLCLFFWERFDVFRKENLSKPGKSPSDIDKCMVCRYWAGFVF